MVSLGCMTLPMSGDFNTLHIFSGFGIAILVVGYAFGQVEPVGPAIAAGSAEQIIDALGNVMIAQAAWCIIYYNYIGCAILPVFCSGAWQMIDAGKQSDNWKAQAGRFSGNQFEQSCVFIPCLWMYATLVDYKTAGVLGLLYCIQRAVYPLFYVIHGRFTLWFENITQIGYTINGVFMVGVLMRALGYDFVAYATENKNMVSVWGACLGVFTLLPGVGVTLPWFISHTLADRGRKASAGPAE